MEKAAFGRLPDGREVTAYTLSGGHGMELTVADYGCRVLRLLVPDRDGRPGDVVLGHRSLEEYLGENYQGACVGRFANRIARGRFSLSGETYSLPCNDGPHSLHGGPGGAHQMLFSACAAQGEEPSVTFTSVSPHGDQGYPGELRFSVTYTLTRDNALAVDYRARCDRDTVFNPTNHSFFNLSADPQQTVLDTRLQIFASRATSVGEDLIPDGILLPVADGPLDFTQPKPIGRDLAGDDPVLRTAGGYDHNFCVDGSGFRPVARASEPHSGRVLEIWSDMPGVQLYTFNRVQGEIGKDGQPMRPHSAFCLETQFYPDTPNHPEFPSCLLKAGEEFRSRTEYRFSVC